MERKRTISQYRERLDKTLASAELSNSETLKSLVKNQILRDGHQEKEGFTENVLEKRTQEVSTFLDMLRSTSVDDHHLSKSSEASHGEWKLKQDNEEFRVMYREGPHGTPFHTLLVEGYVDGPLDVCVCISWESALYKKWWPQSSFPAFKVISSTCLKKVRIGEQISLVRVKVAWPLSAREALVHYVFFEYFQDDLVVVLFNTISDVSSIDKSTHGFTSDGITEAKDVVRIDVVGGFALQKVTNERTYFRTIANMDIKLDFVPPSLINFISRQLVGNGFRLYQKAVASVSDFDEDYSKVLKDPLYALIREALYSGDKSGKVLEGQELKTEACHLPYEHFIEGRQDDMHDTKVHSNDHAGETVPERPQDTKRKAFGEIEEEESEESTCLEEGVETESTFLDEGVETANQLSTNGFAAANGVNATKRISIRPAVEEALGTLEKAISVVRQYQLNAENRSSSFSDEEHPTLEEGAVEDLDYAAEGEDCSNVEAGIEASSKMVLERTLESGNRRDINDRRSAGSYSLSREVNNNKVAPASPLQIVSIPTDTNHVALNSHGNGTIKENGVHENGLNHVKKLNGWKTHRFCCFSFYSGSAMHQPQKGR